MGKRKNRKAAPRPSPATRDAMIMRFPGSADAVDPAVIELMPEHARLIGFLVAEWTQIEYKLTMYLALCLHAEARYIQPMIYAIESSKARINAVGAALRELVDNEPGRLWVEHTLTEAEKLLQQRNKYAHGMYGVDATSGECTLIGMGGRRETKLAPLHDLEHQFERMKALSHRLGVAIAAELGLPLGGPDATDSVPRDHPRIRTRTPPAPAGPPPASPATPADAEGLPPAGTDQDTPEG